MDTPEAVSQPAPVQSSKLKLIIAGGIFVVVVVVGLIIGGGKGLRGSFDDFDPAKDFKIENSVVAQEKESIIWSYKIAKKASNLVMVISKPAADDKDDKPENDELIKIVPLSDSDMEVGEHKITIESADLKEAILQSGTYRFQLIAYNDADEITDFKSEKRTLKVENGAVTLESTKK